VPQYVVPAGSLTDFAVSPRAMVVGAACWSTPTTIESYSSRGPTINPNVTGVKPDMTGLDGVSSGTFGPYTGCSGAEGFFGTSAAAPNVAGAAALARDSDSSLTTPDTLKTRVKTLVTSVGPANTFGTGVLALGTLSAPNAACSPRPNVNVTTTVVGGALRATISATGTSNSIVRVEIGNGSKLPVNALLSFPDGRTGVTGATTSYAPFGATQVTFDVRRQAAGGAVTVPFVAYDRCGRWESFVGGGTSAGF
jgi:hypothetical protein